MIGRLLNKSPLSAGITVFVLALVFQIGLSAFDGSKVNVVRYVIVAAIMACCMSLILFVAFKAGIKR